jgi:hypothetical protein
MLLGWYDREVAAALFEPIRTLMEKTDDQELAEMANPFLYSPTPFLGWSIIDPRAAVARLEPLPFTVRPQNGAYVARERVAELLGLSFEDRWQRIWSKNTEMISLLERDIP